MLSVKMEVLALHRLAVLLGQTARTAESASMHPRQACQVVHLLLQLLLLRRCLLLRACFLHRQLHVHLRLHRRQQLTHAATTAAHTLRGGDGGGSGQGPSLRGSDD